MTTILLLKISRLFGGGVGAAAAAVAKVSSTKIQHGSRSYNNITLVVKFSIVPSPPL